MKINRREFLSTSALVSGSLLTKRSFLLPNDFSILILATNWGFQGSHDEFCAQVKADGYDGIEVWLPLEEKSRNELVKAIEKYDLKYGFLVNASSDDFANNFKEFKHHVELAVGLNPLFINCHSGKDYFSFEENGQVIDYTKAVESRSNIPIYHETHRGRMLYNAPLTYQFLKAYPDLRLTLDISHWCVVHESLLHNQKANIDLALSRTEHVHARVGMAESPQISDPRAPEWATEMNAHFAWWDQVVQTKIDRGDSYLTMTTEFGPPNYMPALPYTQQPVTDLWAINVHMKNLWRERYSSK